MLSKIFYDLINIYNYFSLNSPKKLLKMKINSPKMTADFKVKDLNAVCKKN